MKIKQKGESEESDGHDVATRVAGGGRGGAWGRVRERGGTEDTPRSGTGRATSLGFVVVLMAGVISSESTLTFFLLPLQQTQRFRLAGRLEWLGSFTVRPMPAPQRPLITCLLL